MNAEDFGALVGATVSRIRHEGERLIFETDRGRFMLYHQQECCEYVRIEDICGDFADLIGSPITTAEEECNEGDSPSTLWTFYRIGTAKGLVTIRWCGESDYYRVHVYFVRSEGA